MRKAKTIIALTGVFLLLVSYLNMSAVAQTKTTQTTTKSVQTKTKTVQPAKKTVQTKTKTGTKSQTKSKPTQKSIKAEPVKIKDASVVSIGVQRWAIANLNVSTFRNGDTIPEAKTNKEWVAAGQSEKPAWCYYNNDPKIGLKYGKLYNWYALNDPRGLAPEGWSLATDADWAQLSNSLGGQGSSGRKLKSTTGWNEGDNGTNESGFNGYPGGYRVENGSFQNIGSIGTWWSSTENKATSAFDHYLALGSALNMGNNVKQRGESVRCIKK
jgi:uncharacterized protein (TIGR02145 family)